MSSSFAAPLLALGEKTKNENRLLVSGGDFYLRKPHAYVLRRRYLEADVVGTITGLDQIDNVIYAIGETDLETAQSLDGRTACLCAEFFDVQSHVAWTPSMDLGCITITGGEITGAAIFDPKFFSWSGFYDL